MSMYNYGIGGNEVKTDASESISEIASNRTLLVQKLTTEAPIKPESIYGLSSVEDVFDKFKPSVKLEFQDQEGTEVKEQMNFSNLGDFNAKAIQENSDFLSKLSIEQEQHNKIARQLSSNRALRKALENPEARAAMVQMLSDALAEIDQAQKG
ncbi:type VI secretion system contractile sheath small subunit [Aureivirga marina]|uniref:type VI secretion system contractile sheath small subunit n=1 Tax=Aureivirga marina TaxID=1182451 RepID=UPI0018C93950|nr:type VI secretion system contractile sheath small subunit [Aureivirga marina]